MQDVLEYLRFVLHIQDRIMCMAAYIFFFFFDYGIPMRRNTDHVKSTKVGKCIFELSNGNFTKEDLYKKQFLK